MSTLKDRNRKVIRGLTRRDFLHAAAYGVGGLVAGGCLGLELANAFPANPEWILESRNYFASLMA